MASVDIDSRVLWRFAQITKEVFLAKWIYSLLDPRGSAFGDPYFAHDSKHAEMRLRQMGWSMADVSSLVERIEQGIVVVPPSPKQVLKGSAPKSKRLSLGAALGLGGGGDGKLSDWTRDVSEWAFLQPFPQPQPPQSSPERLAWWAEEGRRRVHGQPARTRRTTGLMEGLSVENLMGATMESDVAAREAPYQPDDATEADGDSRQP